LNGLYDRLFRYRERRRRAPLEDFLSEALADLLQRLPPQVSRDLIPALFLPPAAAKRWAELYGALEVPALRWETQQSTTSGTRGIADMVLFANDTPVLVVENKIGSSVRAHADWEAEESEAAERTDVEELATANQLATYGRWLAGSRASEWPGALALLTHTTAAPDGFLDPREGLYGVPIRRVVNWHDVCAYLRKLAAGGGTEAWCVLSAELVGFLVHNGLGADVINMNDLAAAQVFLPSASRFEETFRRVYAGLETIRRDIFIRSAYNAPAYDAERGMIWDFCYFQPRITGNRPKWYFGWGIRFPASSDPLRAAAGDLPLQPHLFCEIGDDDGDVAEPAQTSGWLWRDGRAFRAKPVHEVSPEPSAFATEFASWVLENLRSAQDLLPQIVSSAATAPRGTGA